MGWQGEETLGSDSLPLSSVSILRWDESPKPLHLSREKPGLQLQIDFRWDDSHPQQLGKSRSVHYFFKQD